MIPRFIKNPSDLQTKHRAVCDGFLKQALQKTKKAEPYVKEAMEFYAFLKEANSASELLLSHKHKNNIAYACGFSDKAKSQLTDSELNNAIDKVLTRICESAGADFRENILYRYLLTRGDSLGGSMRNMIGYSASAKISEMIIEHLSHGKDEIQVVKNATQKIRKITWGDKTLLFDVKPPLVGNYIDVVLIRSDGAVAPKKEKEMLADKTRYLALGEIKGGIDPAGADEHWKTANTALNRIRTTFEGSNPALFFVGAAIETSMSEEIFNQLKTDKLTHAANLNDDNQVKDIVDWLLSL